MTQNGLWKIFGYSYAEKVSCIGSFQGNVIQLMKQPWALSVQDNIYLAQNSEKKCPKQIQL
jgi:hypothetical protein